MVYAPIAGDGARVPGDMTFHVAVARDGQTDDDELSSVTADLRRELLDLDVERVDPVESTDVPEGAKAGVGEVLGWLSAALAAGRGPALVAYLRQWSTRTRHTIVITYGDESLNLTNATDAQVEKIVDSWTARHASGA
jgi:hypothetical protein